MRLGWTILSSTGLPTIVTTHELQVRVALESDLAMEVQGRPEDNNRQMAWAKFLSS